MNFDEHTEPKSTYQFNEITSIAGVKPYVLRFWESEFTQINPILGESGRKIYSNEDLEFVKKVKVLLFDSKLSIPEAKSFLVEELEKKLIEVEAEKNFQAKESLISSEQDPSRIKLHSSSFELMKNALASDLEEKTQAISNKQFSDRDVLSLVQAKKKLTTVLGKINNIITENNW